MERFQQVLINEGHVIYALFRLGIVSEKVINKEIQKDVLRIIAEPRDLAVDLKCFDPIYNKLSCNVRRASSVDFETLVRFVTWKFGERWLQSIDYGFQTYKEKYLFILHSRVK